MFGFNRPFVSRGYKYRATHPNDPDYEEGPEEDEQLDDDADVDDEQLDDEQLDYIA